MNIPPIIRQMNSIMMPYPASEQTAGKVPNDTNEREDDEQTTNETELDPIRFRVCRFDSHRR